MSTNPLKHMNIAVLGGARYGLTLATLIARNCEQVFFWHSNKEELARLKHQRKSSISGR